MNRKEIANVFKEIGVLLELKGENPFKIRAYTFAARFLETDISDEAFTEYVENDKVGELQGIGSALKEKIEVLCKTGKLPFYTELKASVPAGLLEMLDIPGLGGKKIKAIHDQLGIVTIDELKKACTEGRISDLKGFAKKTEANILEGIKNRALYNARHLWWDASLASVSILKGLRELSVVEQAECAGSLRRHKETVGDLDFIVASSTPEIIMDWFIRLPDVKEVTANGHTKSSVRFNSGLQADLRVVPKEQFCFALHHFTGSKDHNVQMRQRALKRGYSLSEWGLKKVDAEDEGQIKTDIDSEEKLFRFLDLDFVEPELREGLGEIDAAEKGLLPNKLKLSDLKGTFHNHSTASDGYSTLDELAREAESRGWEYFGLADHSKASFQANGLNEEQVLSQIEQIEKINQSGKYKTTLFSGIECDILKDGTLDLDNSVLSKLDYVVVSVHSSFSLSEEDMTKRIIRALEHPSATMLGHMTGRILLRREPYLLNVDKVIDAAIANGKIIELNANPKRLDMDWRLWRNAAEKGLLCSINPDAHKLEHFDFMELGVNIACKGWLTAENVFNTKSITEVKQFLSK